MARPLLVLPSMALGSPPEADPVLSMASYDPELRRVVIDVAIDSPRAHELAANVEQLWQFFNTRWQTTAQIHIDGQTRQIDWLQVECGLIEGLPVRARVHALPTDDRPVRRWILSRTDVIIAAYRVDLVDLHAGRRHFERMWAEASEAGPPPIVLQLHGGGEMGEEAALLISGGRATTTARVEGAPLRGVRETMVQASTHAIAHLPRAVRLAVESDFGSSLEREEH